MKWILVIVICVLVLRGCSDRLKEGLPTKTDEYNEIAKEKKLKREENQLLTETEQEKKGYDVIRFAMWFFDYVTLENGTVCQIGKDCQYGKCVKIDWNSIIFERPGGKTFILFRNDLLISEKKEEPKEESITTRLVKATQPKKELQ